MARSLKHPSRRTFIKTLAAGAGASSLGVACTPDQQSPAPRASTVEKPLGIALIGLGYYSTDLLAPALQETKNVKLRGIVTGSPSKIPDWQSKYGIPEANVYNYDTFDSIAENPDIDLVYVVLPNALHKEYTIRAAKAGKHVICEKPMALNAAECEAMIAACQDAGVSLSIGYRMHFEPNTQEVMRFGREQVFGAVNLVSAGAGYRERRADHWKVNKSMGGGAMMDMGVYSLQVARYVTGEEPVSVSAQTYSTRPEIFKEVDETTTFQLQFPSGAVASLETSFSISMNKLHVYASDGWYGLDPFSAYRGVKGESSNGPINFPVINQQAAQMDEVAECIVNGQPMRVPGEEGLRDMKVVEAVYASIAAGGKTILL